MELKGHHLRRIILLACAFVALVCAGIAAATLITFGSTDATVSTLTDSLDINTKGVSQYTAPAAGKLTQIEAYYDGLGKTSGSEKLRLVVYSDSSGVPGNFIAVTNELTVNAGAAKGWHTFTFATQPSVTLNQKLWIGYWAGGTTTALVRPYYDSGTGSVKYNNNTYSSTGSPSNPFGTASTNTKGHPWAIRATLDDGQTCTPVTSTVTTTTTQTVTNTTTVVSTVTTTSTSTTTVTVTGPTTTVTVTTTAPPPPAIPAWPRKAISYGWQISTRDPTQDISYLNDLGAKGARFDYAWGNGAKDSLVDTLRADGLDVYLVIGSTLTPSNMPAAATVQSNCQAIAAKFVGKVWHFVFANEPNTNGFTGSAFVPYQQACYNGLKAGNPDAILGLAGISPYYPSGAIGEVTDPKTPNNWFSSFMSAGGKGSFDFIDTHLYDDPAEQGWWSVWCMTFGCSGGGYYTLDNIVATESQYGINVPIIPGEQGGPVPKYSEAKQATIVTNDLADTRTPASYVYTLRDGDDNGAATGFGLLDPNLQPRQAYNSFKAG